MRVVFVLSLMLKIGPLVRVDPEESTRQICPDPPLLKYPITKVRTLEKTPASPAWYLATQTCGPRSPASTPARQGNMKRRSHPTHSAALSSVHPIGTPSKIAPLAARPPSLRPTHHLSVQSHGPVAELTLAVTPPGRWLRLPLLHVR
jgi:hypothetical protein